MNKKLPPFGTAEYYSTIGKMGGNATKAKHGTKHFSEAGKKGFEATTQKYFGGDEAAHKEWLAKSGAYAYYLTSGLTMKYTADGKPVWPKPARHPSVNILLPF